MNLITERAIESYLFSFAAQMSNSSPPSGSLYSQKPELRRAPKSWEPAVVPDHDASLRCRRERVGWLPISEVEVGPTVVYAAISVE